MLQQPIGFNDSVRRSMETIGLGDNRKGPSSQVELTFSAKNLANRDFVSKSDPICIVYRASTLKGGKTRELARTEVIKDNLSPEWTQRIKIDYFFESKQPLIFKIFDIDTATGNLQDQDFLGSAGCDLADIVASPGGLLKLHLSGKHYVQGDLLIHAQEVDKGQRETLCFNVRLSALKKKSFFTTPNMFVEFHRFLEDGSRFLAHRTQIRKYTANPCWDNLEISLRYLCNCNKDEQFLVECYDKQDDGDSPHLVGAVRTTVSQLLQSQTVRLTLTKQKKIWGTPATVAGKEKERGTLVFDATRIRVDHTFLDYIAGGLQLEFAVCVDFTASNGQQNSMQSLHYIGSNSLNQYEMAIKSVLDICQHYNQQKIFEATGFGAKTPPQYECSHLFPLDVQMMNRRFQGVDGVLEAYKKAVSTIVLFGPTNFGPSITEFMYKAQKMSQNQYQILLIITDGAITDMKRTKELIIRASELPMSIIIIGVGQDTFEKMDKLDSDATLLESGGMRAKRDIVQFVPFRDFVPAHGRFANEDEYYETMRLLAKEVLAEVPEQVTSYMRMKGVVPAKANFNGNGGGAVYPPLPAQNGQNVQAPPYNPYMNGQNSGGVPYPSQNPSQNPGFTPYPTQGQNPGFTPYPVQGQNPGFTPYPTQNQNIGGVPYPVPTAPSLSSPEDQSSPQKDLQQQFGQMAVSGGH